MAMRRELQIGDVFEINTPRGVAFLQYLNRDALMGEFIRVFAGTHAERPASLESIVTPNEQFLAFFPVTAAERKKIVTFVGSAKVPSRLNEFPVLRAPGRIDPVRRKIENWRLWDGKRSWGVDQLSEAERDLSVKEIVGAPILVDRIVTGWVPRDYY